MEWAYSTCPEFIVRDFDIAIIRCKNSPPSTVYAALVILEMTLKKYKVINVQAQEMVYLLNHTINENRYIKDMGIDRMISSYQISQILGRIYSLVGLNPNQSSITDQGMEDELSSMLGNSTI